MTTLVSRNIVVNGRRTSMRLEPEMWDALEDICRREGVTINQFCTIIDRWRADTGMTAATRVFLIQYFRGAAVDTGPGSRSLAADFISCRGRGAPGVLAASLAAGFPDRGERPQARQSSASAS